MDFNPVYISLKTTVCASCITYVLGILSAYLVLRIRNRKIRHIMDVILTLPLVLPPTVAGFFLLYLFGNRRPLGILIQQLFGQKVVFTWAATVIAAVVVSFPLMYRSVKAGFEQLNQSIIEEAKMLGLGGFGMLWRILVPCTMPAILSGTVLSTTRALGEFGATAMLAGNISGKTRTLSLAVYSEVAAGNMDVAGYYVAIILVVAFLAVMVLNVKGDHSDIKL